MIDNHTNKYPSHTPKDRLKAVDMTLLRLRRMRRSTAMRRQRESAIPPSDVAAVVEFLTRHPDVGAEKAHHTLIHQEKAHVSTAMINQTKQALAAMVEIAYRRRTEAEKVIEDELRKRRQALRKEYVHIEATHPNHIWATDFVTVTLLSFRLTLCLVYDIYSQAYLAIRAGYGCDQTLAQETIQAAIACNGRPARYLRRDNGKAFITDSVQELLRVAFMHDAPIPPGSPWFNGSLESSNTSLKTAIKTIAMQHLLSDPEAIRAARQSEIAALTFLQELCDQALPVLNQDIARVKFGMPPQDVLDNKQEPTRQRQQQYIDHKNRERKERMAAIRQSPNRNRTQMSYRAKSRNAIRQRLRTMSTDELYILNEVLHRRFAAVEI